MVSEPSIFDDVNQAADEAADAEALADVEAGRTISWEAVERWLSSCGTDNKLPAPKVSD